MNVSKLTRERRNDINEIISAFLGFFYSPNGSALIPKEHPILNVLNISPTRENEYNEEYLRLYFTKLDFTRNGGLLNYAFNFCSHQKGFDIFNKNKPSVSGIGESGCGFVLLTILRFIEYKRSERYGFTFWFIFDGVDLLDVISASKDILRNPIPQCWNFMGVAEQCDFLMVELEGGCRFNQTVTTFNRILKSAKYAQFANDVETCDPLGVFELDVDVFDEPNVG